MVLVWYFLRSPSEGLIWVCAPSILSGYHVKSRVRTRAVGSRLHMALWIVSACSLFREGQLAGAAAIAATFTACHDFLSRYKRLSSSSIASHACTIFLRHYIQLHLPSQVHNTYYVFVVLKCTQSGHHCIARRGVNIPPQFQTHDNIFERILVPRPNLVTPPQRRNLRTQTPRSRYPVVTGHHTASKAPQTILSYSCTTPLLPPATTHTHRRRKKDISSSLLT